MAVPSEVKGLRTAWRKFGKLEWEKLIEPSITIAENGFPASPHMVVHAKRKIGLITEKSLRYVRLNPVLSIRWPCHFMLFAFN